MLICQESGVEVAGAFDRPLVTLDPRAARTPWLALAKRSCLGRCSAGRV